MYNPIVENLISAGSQVNVTIIFILGIPVLLTLVNIIRYIIGIKAISISGVITMTFLFYSIGSTLSYTNSSNVLVGVSYGVVIISMLFLPIIITHKAITRFQLHYYPRISIILMVTVLCMILLMLIARQFSDQILVQINPLNIVLVGILSEQILRSYLKQGISSSVTSILNSIVISTLGYIFIASPWTQMTMLQYPWIILVLIPANFVIGRYTGLRLTEYIRFYDLLIEHEDKDATDSNSQE